MARFTEPPAGFADPHPQPLPMKPEEQAAVDARHAAFTAWWDARRAVGQDVQIAAQRTYAAMQNWNGIEGQEAWDRLRDQTAEDWESGAALLTMLGGARFIEPGRATLSLMLWQQFLAEYQAQGPAEYMVIAMAVLSFDHFLRVNTLVHNIEARVEVEIFGLSDLRTVDERDPNRRVAKGLTASQLVAELGTDLLPLLDRLNQLVIRNLRALRELKGGPLAVTVANYGQVNVGQTQTNTAPVAGANGVSSPRTRRRP